MPASNFDRFAVGADAGFAPLVGVYNADGAQRLQFYAYDTAFTGGVRVAMGDVNGDTVPDIVTGPGPGGGPHVKVFDGADGRLLAQWFAYDARFTGGISVAIGDVDGDSLADVVTGAGAGGGPHVRVFSALTGLARGEFFAYDASFTGGVWVAAGNVSGTSVDDIITGAGPGGGPHVKIFSGLIGQLYDEYYAYDASYTGGVVVAAADITGDGSADVVTGAQSQGGPHVRRFGSDGLLLAEFMAFSTTFTNGIRVATADVNGDARPDILVGNAAGMSSTVRAFQGLSPNGQLNEYKVFDPSFMGGIFVG